MLSLMQMLTKSKSGRCSFSGYIVEVCHIPCPLDCKLSDWSAWSACSEPHGNGLKIRSRWLREKAFNGGRPCPKLDLKNQVWLHYQHIEFNGGKKSNLWMICVIRKKENTTHCYSIQPFATCLTFLSRLVHLHFIDGGIIFFRFWLSYRGTRSIPLIIYCVHLFRNCNNVITFRCDSQYLELSHYFPVCTSFCLNFVSIFSLNVFEVFFLHLFFPVFIVFPPDVITVV